MRGNISKVEEEMEKQNKTKHKPVSQILSMMALERWIRSLETMRCQMCTETLLLQQQFNKERDITVCVSGCAQKENFFQLHCLAAFVYDSGLKAMLMQVTQKKKKQSADRPLFCNRNILQLPVDMVSSHLNTGQ